MLTKGSPGDNYGGCGHLWFGEPIWRKTGRMGSKLRTYMTHVVRPQLLLQVTPELLVCLYTFSLLPLSHRDCPTQAYPVFGFCCFFCLHACPRRDFCTHSRTDTCDFISCAHTGRGPVSLTFSFFNVPHFLKDQTGRERERGERGTLTHHRGPGLESRHVP